MSLLRVDRSLWAALGMLAATFLVFEFTDLDIIVQDMLFDFEQRRWLIDGSDPWLRLLFYDLPKILLIFLGLSLLTLAFGPTAWRRWWMPAASRKHFLIAFLALASIPAVIGQLKAATNIFCPSEIRRYGGDVPYVRVAECYPTDDRPARRGRCFPAGHASGGFALIGIFGLARSRREQVISLVLTLGLGGAMGFYQMAKGAHYLSHTFITALLAWIGFLLWRRALRVTEDYGPRIERGRP